MKTPSKILNDFLIESGTKNIEHSGETLYDHLVGTWSILKKLECSDDVCNAGLFHSIYGTEVFEPYVISKTQRNDLKNMIGNRSEELVFLFSSLQEPREESIISFSEPNRSDLMIISFANALEQLGWCNELYNMFEPYEHTLPIHRIENL